MIAEELQIFDFDSDSIIISLKIAYFDHEKLFELVFVKDQLLEEEKFNITSFNQLMGLQESDKDKHQDKEDKDYQQDPKMKKKDQLFSTLNQMGMLI